MRVLFLSVLLALGCAEPDSPPPALDESAPITDTVADTVPHPPAESFALPATLTDTLVVEGDPQPVTLRLVRRDDAALPFATYIPEDMTYEATSSGEGEGHEFVLGTPTSPLRASLRLFVPAEGSGLDDPRAYARTLAGDGVMEPVDDPAAWVESAWGVQRGDRFGTVRAGTRNGRRFYTVEDIREEMGDGFWPRAELVLAHWLWLPDGTYLEDPLLTE